MEKVLFIDACVRPQSRTRALAAVLLDALGAPYDKMDIPGGGILPLDAAALEKRTQASARGDFSDAAYDAARQFAAADTVVIAAPFWDLSFSSFLKIYFENILVPGLTFVYKGGRPQGICRAKRLFYVTTAGGAAPEDFGFAYVRALAERFFGIPDVRAFCAEGLDIVGNDADAILRDAAASIRAAVCDCGGDGRER